MVPTFIIADAAHDDALFVRLAIHIRDGDWLGPFATNTLAKGPAYPLFLAFVSLFPSPPIVAIHLLHILAGGVAGFLVYRAVGRRAIGMVTFAVVALDPVFFGFDASRLTRDSWYSSIALLLFSVVGLASLTVPSSLASIGPRVRYILRYGTAMGLLVSAYWLGREERPWLLPALIVLAVGGVVAMRSKSRWGRELGAARVTKARPMTALSKSSYVTFGLVFALSLGTFASAILAISASNDSHYGAFLVNDFVDGQFPRAYGLWQSVDAGPVRRFVPIGKQQREAVYKVSPAARELQPALEGSEKAWAGYGCQVVQVCDDFAAGWLVWALRDAVSAAGYRSAGRTQAFYHRLGDQIAQACHSGSLHCEQPMPGLFPRPSSFTWRGVVWFTTASVKDSLDYHIANPDRPLSSANSQEVNWRIFARSMPGVPRSRKAYDRYEKVWLPRVGAPVRLLGSVYRIATYVMLPLALLGYSLTVLRRRRARITALIVGLAAGSAVAGRSFMLGLTQAGSFGRIGGSYGGNYVLPTYSFVQVFIIVGASLCFAELVPGTRSSLKTRVNETTSKLRSWTSGESRSTSDETS